MVGKILRSSSEGNLFLVELTDEHGNVVGYQLQRSDGTLVSGVTHTTFEAALREFENLLDALLLDRPTGDPESESSYSRPGF